MPTQQNARYSDSTEIAKRYRMHEIGNFTQIASNMPHLTQQNVPY